MSSSSESQTLSEKEDGVRDTITKILHEYGGKKLHSEDAIRHLRECLVQILQDGFLEPNEVHYMTAPIINFVGDVLNGNLFGNSVDILDVPTIFICVKTLTGLLCEPKYEQHLLVLIQNLSEMILFVQKSDIQAYRHFILDCITLLEDLQILLSDILMEGTVPEGGCFVIILQNFFQHLKCHTHLQDEREESESKASCSLPCCPHEFPPPDDYEQPPCDVSNHFLKFIFSEVSTLERCTLLQTGITDILDHLYSNMSLFVFDEASAFCQILLKQLLMDSTHLKEVSVSALTTILKSNGLSPIDHQGVIECIWRLLHSNQKNVSLEFDTKFAKLLQKLPELTNGLLGFVFVRPQLEHWAAAIASNIETTESIDLKRSLCGLFCDFIQKFPSMSLYLHFLVPFLDSSIRLDIVACFRETLKRYPQKIFSEAIWNVAEFPSELRAEIPIHVQHSSPVPEEQKFEERNPLEVVVEVLWPLLHSILNQIEDNPSSLTDSQSDGILQKFVYLDSVVRIFLPHSGDEILHKLLQKVGEWARVMQRLFSKQIPKITPCVKTLAELVEEILSFRDASCLATLRTQIINLLKEPIQLRFSAYAAVARKRSSSKGLEEIAELNTVQFVDFCCSCLRLFGRLSSTPRNSLKTVENALRDNSEKIRAAAFRILPCYLVVTDYSESSCDGKGIKKDRQYHARKLQKKLIVLNDESVDVRAEWSVTIGHLACILANPKCVGSFFTSPPEPQTRKYVQEATLSQSQPDTQHSLNSAKAFDELRIYCPCCDRADKDDIAGQAVSVDFKPFAQFFSKLGDENPSHVRVNMIRSAFRILHHCDFSKLQYTKQITDVITNVLFDRDPEVRKAACDSAQFLLDWRIRRPDFDPETYDGTGGPILDLFKPIDGCGGHIWMKLHDSIMQLITLFSEKTDNFEFDSIERSSTVSVLSTIACVTHGKTQARIIANLLGYLTNLNYNIRAFTFDSITKVARSMRMETSELIRLHKKVLYPHLFETAIGSSTIVDEVCEALLGIDYHMFLNEALEIVIPSIIKRQQRQILYQISKRTGQSQSSLVRKHMHLVLSDLMMASKTSANPQQFKECWKFVQEIFPSSQLGELLRTCSDEVTYELICNMAGVSEDSDEYYQALSALWCVVLAEDGLLGNECSVVPKSMEPDQNRLAEFVSVHFLRMIDVTNAKIKSSHFHSKATEIMEKNNALATIQCFIKLLKPKLPAYVPKLMSTLRMSLRQTDIRVKVLDVWETFVRELMDLGAEHIGRYLSQLVVTLLSDWDIPRGLEDGDEKNSDEQNELLAKLRSIMSFLFIEHKDALKVYFKGIPLLPADIPTLQPIFQTVRDVIGDNTCEVRMRQLLTSLDHESPNVRTMTLRRMCYLITANRRVIFHTTFEQGTNRMSVLGTAIRDLVTKLLQLCRDPDNDVKIEVSKVIGELGAIAPSVVNVQNVRPTLSDEMEDDALAVEIINSYLVPALKVNDRLQNRFLFAIQELLQHYLHCTADTPLLYKEYGKKTHKSPARNTRRAKKASSRHPNGPNWAAAPRNLRIWNMIHPDVRAVVEPCLTSIYVSKDSEEVGELTDSQRNPGILRKSATRDNSNFQAREEKQSKCFVGSRDPKVFYEPKSSHGEWLSKWTRYLINEAKGKRALIFIACCGIVKFDLKLAAFLLAYLVENVLRYGPSQLIDQIREECLAVLSNKAMDSGVFYEGSGFLSGQSLHNSSQMSTQTIFELMDLLQKWSTGKRFGSAYVEEPPKRRSKRRKVDNEIERALIEEQRVQIALKNLLMSIQKEKLSLAAFRCKAYTRALMYFEQSMKDKEREMREKSPNACTAPVFDHAEEDWEFLQRIYAEIDETDGMCGIAVARKTTNLEQQARDYENAGKWEQALSCYEQSIIQNSSVIENHIGLLNCHRNLGHLPAVIAHVRSVCMENPEFEPIVSASGVQAAWRLQKWDLLDSFLEKVSDRDAGIEVQIGRCLADLHKNDYEAFESNMLKAREDIMRPLAAASMESYQRAYPYFIQLHMLQELYQGGQLLFQQNVNDLKRDGGQDHFYWDRRLQNVKSVFHIREAILSLRRVIYGSAGLDEEAGSSWLAFAKEARASGQYHVAQLALMNAARLDVPQTVVERAELIRETGDSHEALMMLENYRRQHEKQLKSVANSKMSPAEQIASIKFHAEVHLLIGNWSEEIGAKDSHAVLREYSSSNQLMDEKWEPALFHLGQFYERLMKHSIEELERKGKKKGSAIKSYIKNVISNYGLSMTYGNDYIFQSLPRLLTLFFEYAPVNHPDCPYKKTSSSSSNRSSRNRSSRNKASLKAADIEDFRDWVATWQDQVASFQWMTALPQIISHLCHKEKRALDFIEAICIKLFKFHPHQAFWAIAPLQNYTQAKIAKRAQSIMDKVLKKTSPRYIDLSLDPDEKNPSDALVEIIDDGLQLFKHFITLCESINTNSRMTKAYEFDLGDKHPRVYEYRSGHMIVPIQSNLTVTLPPEGTIGFANHDGFPNSNVKIVRFRKTCAVLKSKEKPVKITLLGSDGRTYPFLCKRESHGDMRKDARMAQFNTVVNRLLKKDPQTRERRCSLRTYAVHPMTENCGILEWVNNTTGFRHCCQTLGIDVSWQKIREVCPDFRTAQEAQKKIRNYNTLLEIYPAVFHKWFLNTFPEPTSWFESRLNFARSCAAWSMVGYLVGLGDRHGENLLLDETNGECVHVDFDCLFDKGKELETPELVPFRLTQNMVDAFGVTGVEGVFRKSCEQILRVLRENRETLMSVLHTFVADPLLEHASGNMFGRKTGVEEIMKHIAARLLGKKDDTGSLCISVQGQVHQLINEATSEDLLSQMYVGWMAWI